MKNVFNNLILCFSFALLLLVFSGCNNLFEAEVSTNVETDDILKSGYAGADMMLKGAFQAFANVADDISIHCSIASDDADETNGHTTNADEDMGKFLAYNPEPKLMYFGLHDARGQADRFLTTYLDKFDLNTNYGGGAIPVVKRKNTMIAFASLVRGWSTLYLGMLFEKVNFNQGAFITPTETINKAITDFLTVEDLYKSGATDEAYFNGISIREAASTLLAKAYLQNGRYDLAITAANSGYKKTVKGTSGAADGIVNVFYAISAANITTIDGNLIFTHVGNNTNTQKSWAMTSWFLQNDVSDQRIALDSATAAKKAFTFSASNDRSTITSYKLGYTVPRIPAKYGAATVQEKPLRLLSWQDNALTWAEALVRNGDIGGGASKVNEVRTGLKNDAGSVLPTLTFSTQQDGLDKILIERRIEFFVELGDRFIAFKRYGVKHEVSGVDYVWPVPTSE